MENPEHRRLWRCYKAGYEVWIETSAVECEAEIISNPDNDESLNEFVDQLQQPSIVTMKSAYTPEGWYIGNPKNAHYLVKKRGIKPELINPEANVCSIGFCEKEQKWFGWSHRAIYGFGIGNEVKEGDCCATSGWTDEYLAEHPEEDTSLPVGFTAHDLEDAKRMAVAFAEGVS